MSKASSNERPYPPGIAWDEAWRQRQRANELEARYTKLSEAVKTFLGKARRFETVGKTVCMYVPIKEIDELHTAFKTGGT